ncbi:hypothetical protein FVEG_15560 [Fusarium verticillioides 7600]|uniref:Uncharacterized protein n=1 Tax=Gibberella moniliformis (strain M3125 / FGSC 7600) TaxID=334819 RepID=W7LVQ7_GIBM7|nr:hypothetical protein FVEG_15560 [Fusarium verticillioides 7600]XP_018749525.1 hypothetical protein FVEG_15560 [Fusarium verticillioides 7600]XP_018749526.1 hypothetical protein FVEG_15560 [Fusarium verticillioides 7600]XP_018749527.1 hypothetical protein FVEG_15560 [Fusarium verticillioides 7600]XP_018749528.1 hypothetical protein FVEG_15560 [Fusarium verticillioides 7600]XP_018749529.1 hypothetical protein FVEG_15560 [Fusarium verticillioides 7600]XP_018749530.1 hypothetical protein FVEG_
MGNQQNCGKPGSPLQFTHLWESARSCNTMVAAKDCFTNLTSQQLPRVSEPLGREPASCESRILLVDSLKAAGQQSQMRLTHRSRINIFPCWGFVAFAVIPNRGAAQLQLQSCPTIQDS